MVSAIEILEDVVAYRAFAAIRCRVDYLGRGLDDCPIERQCLALLSGCACPFSMRSTMHAIKGREVRHCTRITMVAGRADEFLPKPSVCRLAMWLMVPHSHLSWKESLSTG